MGVTQGIQDNRVSNKTTCNIDLTALVEASDHSDPEVREQSQLFINTAYQLQGDVSRLTERLKCETLADFESKWADALIEKERLEGELKTFNLEGYSFQAENGRIQGRIQLASNRLSDHQATKAKWHKALTSPKQVQEWQFKHDQLLATLDDAKRELTTLQGNVNAFQNDQAVLANKIRVATAQAIYLYNRIERLKGSKEPIFAPGSNGLAS
jgi:predicted  nucleic acid-binding Zn-ribbon protein